MHQPGKVPGVLLVVILLASWRQWVAVRIMVLRGKDYIRHYVIFWAVYDGGGRGLRSYFWVRSSGKCIFIFLRVVGETCIRVKVEYSLHNTVFFFTEKEKVWPGVLFPTRKKEEKRMAQRDNTREEDCPGITSHNTYRVTAVQVSRERHRGVPATWPVPSAL